MKRKGIEASEKEIEKTIDVSGLKLVQINNRNLKAWEYSEKVKRIDCMASWIKSLSIGIFIGICFFSVLFYYGIW